MYDLNVVDLPQPCEAKQYDEAASRYAAAVKSRAIAVYQIGDPRYPGISPLDLLVITDHVGVDNRFFFSALQRLPSRHHALLVREPYVLPPWSLRVMQHTPHVVRRLGGGRDVIAAYAWAGEPGERWCRMLEAYCAYSAFCQSVSRSGELKGREALAEALSLASVLQDARMLLPDAQIPDYESPVEQICATFFDANGKAADNVRDVWRLFAAAFSAFDEALRRHIGASNTPECVARVRSRLAGDEECADFDREYAFRRARDIDGYHQELASLGFPFGQLFPSAAYPAAMRPLPAMPLLDVFVRHAYRLRRRITEYAAGT